MPEIININHVCEYLQVSRNVGYTLMKSKGFPAYRVGEKLLRVNRDDFLEWVANMGKSNLGNDGLLNSPYSY